MALGRLPESSSPGSSRPCTVVPVRAGRAGQAETSRAAGPSWRGAQRTAGSRGRSRQERRAAGRGGSRYVRTTLFGVRGTDGRACGTAAQGQGSACGRRVRMTGGLWRRGRRARCGCERRGCAVEYGGRGRVGPVDGMARERALAWQAGKAGGATRHRLRALASARGKPPVEGVPRVPWTGTRPRRSGRQWAVHAPAPPASAHGPPSSCGAARARRPLRLPGRPAPPDGSARIEGIPWPGTAFDPPVQRRCGWW